MIYQIHFKRAAVDRVERHKLWILAYFYPEPFNRVYLTLILFLEHTATIWRSPYRIKDEWRLSKGGSQMLSQLEREPHGFSFRHHSRFCGSGNVIGSLWAVIGGRENQQQGPRIFMPAVGTGQQEVTRGATGT